MNPMTCIVALLLFTPHPAVPAAALPEAVQVAPLPAAPPPWSEEALAARKSPWVAWPNPYDHRYVTW